MIKKLISAAVAAVMLGSYAFSVSAADETPAVGMKLNGFTVTDTRAFDIMGADLITFEHDKTGAQVLFVSNDDINRAFDISFRTPAQGDTGITHVFEHSALSGSEKYPSDTLALKLMSQAYTTFMNATTNQNNTNYMFSSLSEEQLYNLADYYLSGVFDTLIYTDPSIKEREAWHYELNSPEEELKLAGTVYSEMRGMMSDMSAAALYNFRRDMYAGCPDAFNPGGAPEYIPELTNEDLISYHSEYYHPSNSLTVMYGDIDYTDFLALLDSYFSEYDRKDIKIDLTSGLKTDGYTENTYKFPVSADTDTENRASMIYAYQCKGITKQEFVKLSVLLSRLNSELLPELSRELLPGAAVSCGLINDTAVPSVIFMADGVDPSDKDTFITLVKTAIERAREVDDSFNETLAEQMRIQSAMAGETSDAGVGIAVSAAVMWSAEGDIYSYFDYEDMLLDKANYDYSGIADKYFSDSARRTLTITVPEAGLLEKQEAERKQKLAAVKADMTEAELNGIVSSTAEYKSGAELGNDELDRKLISEISTVDVEDLTETFGSYPLTDETAEGVQYVSAEAAVGEIGKGRIMLDVSDFTEDELHWLSLYDSLLGGVDTHAHKAEELPRIFGRYSDCGTDIMLIGNGDDFTPYMIFRWTGFSENAAEIYKTADEFLFDADFSNTDAVINCLWQMLSTYEASFPGAGYEEMIMRGRGTENTAQAFMNRINGLEFYDFLSEVIETAENDPQELISKLDAVREKLYNKTGAIVLYAGSKESIKENRAAAELFFKNIPAADKAKADYSGLKNEYISEALPTDSSVNYNGMYIPFSKAGVNYNGSIAVLSGLLTDSYLITQLRNKHNAYGGGATYDEYSLTLYSYRDPVIQETFDEFAGAADYLRSGDITQATVDNYIKQIYSNMLRPKGVLTDAYNYADNYLDGHTEEYYNRLLNEVKAVTVPDLRGYADMLDLMMTDGIRFTVGSDRAIRENAYMYDDILYEDDIEVTIDGVRLTVPVEPYIENDRTMIPMRAVFEALGADVEWNDAQRSVTARKDGESITLTIGSHDAAVVKDGIESIITAENAPEIAEDYTMIPLRLTAEALGCGVDWNGRTQTVEIKTK